MIFKKIKKMFILDLQKISISKKYPEVILLTEETIRLRVLTEQDSDSWEYFPYDANKF